MQFLNVVDSSIMNVVLPSIRRDLGFSAQGLQWVLPGYLVTYGGLLPGGRAADLLGRRRMLVAGTALFAACSLAGGLAVNAGMLVGARLVQGTGAALLACAVFLLAATVIALRAANRRGEPAAIAAGVRAASGPVLRRNRSTDPYTSHRTGEPQQ